jgi:anti-anti-sigma factor
MRRRPIAVCLGGHVLDDGEQLHLHTSFDGGTATLQASGELDIYTSSRLLAVTEQLCTRELREIVVRGDELSFVDSAGLRALVLAHDRASMQGIDLRVGSASDALDKVLTMTGLDELLVK